jgi:putative SOS response-associated peptidase YedK
VHEGWDFHRTGNPHPLEKPAKAVTQPAQRATSTRSPRTKLRSWGCSESSTSTLATWRRCRGVFPDYPAPVIRNVGAEREMLMMRWGMPPPPRTGGPPVTNIRNTSSPHWRGWLKPESRCLVPANSFAEYAPEPNPETKKKDVVWFALNDDRPLTAFAGIWTEFKGDRGTKSKPIPGPHLVYGFLTTTPNAIVEPIHPKAMPVILTTQEECDVWMRAVGRSEGIAATVARRRVEDRSAWGG